MKGAPVNYEGVSYPSRRAFALAHGISRHSVYTRITAGVPVEEALVPTHGRTLTKVRTRGEWLVASGHDIAGLCTSTVWEAWGKFLRLLYRDHSTTAIAELFGVAPRVIQMDLRMFGIEARSKGGANRRTEEYGRRLRQAAIEEVWALQRDQRREMRR